MSQPIFTWYPDVGSQRAVKPLVHSTKFGDGYEVRVPMGINTLPAKWTLTFTREINEFTAIKTFIETCGGLLAFTWTDPLNNTVSYVCRDWTTSQPELGIYVLQATFEQVFEF